MPRIHIGFFGWLASKEIAEKVLNKIFEQGFSIALLLIAVGFMYVQLSDTRAEMRQRDQLLRQEINECNNSILQYYRDDQKKTNAALMRANDLMDRIEQKLEQ
jgi:uncharacterized membrane protein YciS (DUF1049 family)